ncbi:MAG TPA: hypothetical protein VG712_02145, partial [Gemmatimonadales bacterium]|nr:hypothetical protein [Gemmatimonadales bacterium]
PTADTTGALMTNAGVVRAAGVVDSVFVAPYPSDSATVDAGDWTAYLMARLGVRPIPEMGLRVTIDSLRLRVRGRISDLPPEARTALAGFVALLDPATPFEASVALDRAAPNAIRFHLDSAWIAGYAIPDPILSQGLRVVGEKYPVLANGGRDLFVETPINATVRFTALGVRLMGPPRAVPPRRPR